MLKRAAVSIVSDVKVRHDKGVEKRRILGLLDLSELKLIVSGYGISVPDPFDYDPITGKKTKRTVGRKDYVRAILNEMDLEKLRAYCKKKKIVVGEK